jgi:hypothetical protein
MHLFDVAKDKFNLELIFVTNFGFLIPSSLSLECVFIDRGPQPRPPPPQVRVDARQQQEPVQVRVAQVALHKVPEGDSD